MRSILRLLDWIYFLRPVLHPPVWTILILGYYSSPVKSIDSNLAELLLLSSGLASWAYVVNQIADIETDRINKKNQFLSSGIIKANQAKFLAMLILFAALIGSFILGFTIGIISVSGLILGFFYSFGPIPAKDRPFLSALFNGAGHGAIIYIYGFIGAGGLISHALVKSIPYFFAVIAVFIGTTLPDIPGDKKIGKITPGVAMGLNYSIAAMTLSLMCAMLLSLIFWDLILLIVCNISLPFYLYSSYKRTVSSAVLASRISVLFLSLAACYFLPVYFLALLLLFAISKYYFRKRFNISYPGIV